MHIWIICKEEEKMSYDRRINMYVKGDNNDEWERENEYLMKCGIEKIIFGISSIKIDFFRMIYVNKEKKEYLIPFGMTNPNRDGSDHIVYSYIFFSDNATLCVELKKGKQGEVYVIERVTNIKRKSGVNVSKIKDDISDLIACARSYQSVIEYKDDFIHNNIIWECELN